MVIDWTVWIDVCQSNGNLLASGGQDSIIKIFDKRGSKIVKTFQGVHSSKELHSIFVFIRYWGFVCCLICLIFIFYLQFDDSFEITLDAVVCVRWNPSGDMIASSSWDKTAKLLDFKTGKVLHTGTNSDESKCLVYNINLLHLILRFGYFCLLHLNKI